MKRLYNWVLSWANTPYGSIALFIHAMVEAIFFPVPPDVLLIALAVGDHKKSYRFAAICLAGSLLGAVIGYSLGYYLWIGPNDSFTSFADFFFNHIPGFTIQVYESIRDIYNQWDFWAIFAAGFTPIPFKVFTITAGVFNIDFPVFIVASAISRGARFFLIAILIWKYGAKIKDFIDKQFNLLAIVFTLLLVLGFLVIKYFI